MKRLLPLFLLAMLLLPATAMAQWDFDGVFPPDTLQTDGNGMHGVAVDPDGKVWLQTFGATDSVDVPGLGFQAVRVIYVFNPDGTEAIFSPIKFVDFAGGERDTLGGFLNAGAWEGKSGRGLRADADGNIIVSQFNFLYKLDYQTGAGLAKARFEDYCSLTQAATDDVGNVYVAPVCPGPPLRQLDSDLNFVANVTDVVSNFSRGIIASPDGLRIYETDFENTFTIIHERADEFSAFDSVGVAFRGMRAESGAINPKTGNIWVSAGNPLNGVNDDAVVATDWMSNTWYEFDPDEILNNDNPTPLNLIQWEGCENFIAGVCQDTAGRPRGLAFSPDGETAYVVQFSAGPGDNVQRFVEADFTSIERNEGIIPESFTIGQNYPNPFASSTSMKFELTDAGYATLTIYDMLGREVETLVDEHLPSGSYTATFEAKGLAAGTYLYVLQVDDRRLSGKMLLMK